MGKKTKPATHELTNIAVPINDTLEFNNNLSFDNGDESPKFAKGSSEKKDAKQIIPEEVISEIKFN